MSKNFFDSSRFGRVPDWTPLMSWWCHRDVSMMSWLLKKFISNSRSVTPTCLSDVEEFSRLESIWLSCTRQLNTCQRDVSDVINEVITVKKFYRQILIYDPHSPKWSRRVFKIGVNLTEIWHKTKSGSPLIYLVTPILPRVLLLLAKYLKN